MPDVAVIARIAALPGKRAELAEALHVALDQVEQEPGTRYYLLHEARDDEDSLWMYEMYETQDDLDAHMGAPWFAELVPTIGPLLNGLPELTFLKPLGGKGA